MRRIPGWLALGILVPVSALASQTDARDPGGRWTIALSRGAATLSGASRGRGPEGEPLEFVPHRPGLWGVSIGYGRSARGVLAVRHGGAGLRLRGAANPDDVGGVIVLSESVFRLTTLDFSGSVPVARLRGGPLLRLGAGVGIEWWAAENTATRQIATFEGRAGLETAIAGPLVAQLAVALGYSPASPFRTKDLPGEFSVRPMWRKGVSVAVGVRF